MVYATSKDVIISVDYFFNNMENLFERKEVASMLKISEDTFDSLVKRGYIDSIIIGNRRRYSEKHISDFLKRNEVKNAY